jgi:hypothetical protein
MSASTVQSGAVRILILAAALGLGAASVATAQRLPPPDTTDLHVAYCIGAIKAEIDGAQRDPTKSAQSTLATMSASLRKLQRYLQPRLRSVDPTGLQSAQRSGKDNWDRLNSTNKSCFGQCRRDEQCYNQCTTREMPDFHPVQNNQNACVTLDWLP